MVQKRGLANINKKKTHKRGQGRWWAQFCLFCCIDNRLPKVGSVHSAPEGFFVRKRYRRYRRKPYAPLLALPLATHFKKKEKFIRCTLSLSCLVTLSYSLSRSNSCAGIKRHTPNAKPSGVMRHFCRQSNHPSKRWVPNSNATC